MLRTRLVAVLVVMCATPALAHDIDIPDWWGPDSWYSSAQRYAGFEFNDSGIVEGGEITPDFGDNPGARAVWHPCTPEDEWIDDWSPTYIDFPWPRYLELYGQPYPTPQSPWAGFGVLPLSGTIDITLPNDHEPNPMKEFWVQMTWAPQAGGSSPVPWIEVISADGNPLPAGAYVLHEQQSFQFGPWTHSRFRGSLPFNPSIETIRISGDILVDEVIVDTWCVPEPASLSMLAFGVLMLRRRAR